MAHAAGYDTVTTSRAVWNMREHPSDLLGRIAIMRGADPKQFAAALSGHDVRARKLRDSALAGAKLLLGNTLYEKLRAVLLG